MWVDDQPVPGTRADPWVRVKSAAAWFLGIGFIDVIQLDFHGIVRGVQLNRFDLCCLEFVMAAIGKAGYKAGSDVILDATGWVD